MKKNLFFLLVISNIYSGNPKLYINELLASNVSNNADVQETNEQSIPDYRMTTESTKRHDYMTENDD